MWAPGREGAGYGSYEVGIYRSFDGGSTWSSPLGETQFEGYVHQGNRHRSEQFELPILHYGVRRQRLDRWLRIVALK